MKLRQKDGSLLNGTFLKSLGDTVGKDGSKGTWTRCLYKLDDGFRVAEAFVPASGRPVSEAEVFVVRYASSSEQHITL